MHLEFAGEVWFWKGPSPWYFVTVPEAESEQIAAVSTGVSYGWGVVPVTAEVRGTSWQTSLFPREGQYLVPLKAWVRTAQQIALGDLVTVALTVGR